jgi:hypothetical protein
VGGGRRSYFSDGGQKSEIDTCCRRKASSALIVAEAYQKRREAHSSSVGRLVSAEILFVPSVFSRKSAHLTFAFQSRRPKPKRSFIPREESLQKYCDFGVFLQEQEGRNSDELKHLSRQKKIVGIYNFYAIGIRLIHRLAHRKISIFEARPTVVGETYFFLRGKFFPRTAAQPTTCWFNEAKQPASSSLVCLPKLSRTN